MYGIGWANHHQLNPFLLGSESIPKKSLLLGSLRSYVQCLKKGKEQDSWAFLVRATPGSPLPLSLYSEQEVTP